MSARTTDVVWRDPIFIVIGVHQPSERHLALIVHTEDAVRFSFRLTEGREQHACEDGDDRDDDKELDQGECLPLLSHEGFRIHYRRLGNTSGDLAREKFREGTDGSGWERKGRDKKRETGNRSPMKEYDEITNPLSRDIELCSSCVNSVRRAGSCHRGIRSSNAFRCLECSGVLNRNAPINGSCDAGD